MATRPGPGEFEEFAECLRALKERAGHTFEALSQKTGIGSSTLHRYCSGSHVPKDYGAAHRFATACGASAEELRRVHRLWALADARRDAEQETGTGGEQEEGVSAAPATALSASRPPLRRGRKWALVVGTVLVTAGAVAWAMTAASAPDPATGSATPKSTPESAPDAAPVLVRPGAEPSAAPMPDGSWSPKVPAADCPTQGQLFKTYTHERVYLVGPGRRLYYIPNATTYFNLWDNWDAVTSVGSEAFADCDWPRAYELTDAFLVKPSGSARPYIWDAWSGYRRIASEAVLNRYGFSRTKVQIRTGLSPVSRDEWD